MANEMATAITPSDDDADREPDTYHRYSETCTRCWWWKPLDHHKCAAYPRPGSLPMAIWNDDSATDHHLHPLPGDHGIVFVLHPDAEKQPPAWAKSALRVGSPAATAMLAKSEALKAGAKAGKAGRPAKKERK
jgi:hypothetical protein